MASRFWLLLIAIWLSHMNKGLVREPGVKGQSRLHSWQKPKNKNQKVWECIGLKWMSLDYKTPNSFLTPLSSFAQHRHCRCILKLRRQQQHSMDPSTSPEGSSCMLIWCSIFKSQHYKTALDLKKKDQSQRFAYCPLHFYTKPTSKDKVSETALEFMSMSFPWCKMCLAVLATQTP
jgi:hypothetical protein